MADARLPTAPWKPLFLSHIQKMSQPAFVLSTVAKAPTSSSSSASVSPVPYVPRARYVIFRGFWGELPENKHNSAAQNPRAYESELPTITTDVRMQKVEELFESSEGHAESKEQEMGTGGGGPVEAVWWVEETQTQWRMKGKAYVVSKDDIEGEGEQSSGVRTVKSQVGKRMRVVDENKKGEWTWTREVLAHFGNHSPAMRGSFRNPPPGQPTSASYNASDLALGQKVDSNDDPVALSNFRVVIILPDSMEQTDLSNPDKARRELYTFDGGSGEWKTEELWP